MTEGEKQNLEAKYNRLTITGAREFWNEICEWLDSLIVNSDNKLRNAENWDEVRKYQILRKLCFQMKRLPENMVLMIKQQIAEQASGEKKDALNFFAEETPGVKTEV